MKEAIKHFLSRAKFRRVHFSRGAYVSLSCTVDGTLIIGHQSIATGVHFRGDSIVGNANSIGRQSVFTHSKTGSHCRIGKDCSIYASELEDRVAIHDHNALNHAKFGVGAYAAEGSRFDQCTIGAYCSIGPQCLIGMGDHPTNFVLTSPICYRSATKIRDLASGRTDFTERRPISIGNDVWLGARVIIRDGITIGDGAIIGAGSVVTKDIEPYAIAVGAPARKVRDRTPTNIRERMIQSQWWTIPAEAISAYFQQNHADDWDAFLRWAKDQEKA